MSNSRRVYISSVDNITPDPKFSTIELNLANARLERKSHQRLSVALVKASFPAEMGALPVTSVVSTDIKRDISVLAFATTTGAKQRIYYNQTNTTMNSGANIHNGYWTLNTTIDQILAQINSIAGGGSLLQLDSLNRLIIGTGGAGVRFYWDDSSVKIMTTLGLKRTLPAGSAEEVLITAGANVPARDPVNVASILPVIYITTNLNLESFTSAKKGQSVNILGSVPVSLDITATGNSTLISVINGVQQVNTPSTQLNYTNHSLAGSHKSIDAKIISDLVLNLVNDELRPIGTLGKEWNLTLDVKIIDSAN
jgi:hypothetical protein